MKTVIHSNGVQSEYDDTLKAGDIITSYYKGFFEFLYFEDRGAKQVPLAFFKQKFRVNGKEVKSPQIRFCDASYCRNAVEQIRTAISEKKQEIKRLSELLKKL